MKKYLTIFILFTSVAFSQTKNWKVIVFNDNFYIENQDKKSLRHKLISSGGEPKFHEVVVKTNRVSLIVYYSGSAGTSTIVKSYRALVWDNKIKDFRGDFPYKSISNSGKFPQPQWTFEAGKIKIFDPESDFRKTIKL